MEKFKFERFSTTPDNSKWKNCVERENKMFYRRDDDIRSEFYRDYTRVLHSQPYSRLKHKTQVFFATQNDHVCTRMEHVHHVASVSYSIAQKLGLNTELTQAIALSHDIGHAPFGHEGEQRLKKITKENLHQSFWHEKNGLYVVDNIATIPNINNKHQNFNLTYAVRDGIISHCGEIDENGLLPRDKKIELTCIDEPNKYRPYTWEACVVKVSDKIAYLGRDIQDAMELGIFGQQEFYALKKIMTQYSDSKVINNTVLIHKLIADLCQNSSPEDGICFSEQNFNLIKEVKNFNYKYIYSHPKIEAYKQFTGVIIHSIYEFLQNYCGKYDVGFYTQSIQRYPLLMRAFTEWLIKYSTIDVKRKKKMRFENKVVYDIQDEAAYKKAVVDFIAGMTDNFALKVYEEIIRF